MKKAIKTVLAVTSMLFLVSIKSSGQTILFYGPVLNPALTFSKNPAKPKFSSDLLLGITLAKKKWAGEILWSPATESIIVFNEIFLNKGGGFGKQPIGIAGIVGFDYSGNSYFMGIGPDIAINGGKQWMTPMVSFNPGSKTTIRLNIIIPFQWKKEWNNL